MNTTIAYRKHAKSIQDTFNFSVMVCHAVKTMEAHLDSVDAGTTPLVVPYYYLPPSNTAQQLRSYTNSFEQELCKHLYLSVFAFFEDFVSSLVDEFIQFHLGLSAMIARARKIDKTFISKQLPNNMLGELKKVRQQFNAGRVERYRKATRILKAGGFRFPSEMFSSYGIQRMSDDLRKLKAYDIPNFLMLAFHVPFDESDVRRFHQFREKRNEIAHGDTVHLTLRDVSDIHGFFAKWASLLNKHFTDHYFIIERYA